MKTWWRDDEIIFYDLSTKKSEKYSWDTFWGKLSLTCRCFIYLFFFNSKRLGCFTLPRMLLDSQVWRSRNASDQPLQSRGRVSVIPKPSQNTPTLTDLFPMTRAGRYQRTEFIVYLRDSLASFHSPWLDSTLEQIQTKGNIDSEIFRGLYTNLPRNKGVAHLLHLFPFTKLNVT